ncbi:MAG: LPS translocon maturation chaperone LptM [Burkholderiales bacterium]
MRIVSLLVALSILISGCGYKGPLYLPKKAPEQHQESK